MNNSETKAGQIKGEAPMGASENQPRFQTAGNCVKITSS